eukprot:gene15315-4586_t
MPTHADGKVIVTIVGAELSEPRALRGRFVAVAAHMNNQEASTSKLPASKTTEWESKFTFYMNSVHEDGRNLDISLHVLTDIEET